VKLDPGAHVFYAFGFALKSGCDIEAYKRYDGQALGSEKVEECSGEG
jgi:hypothetical protein